MNLSPEFKQFLNKQYGANIEEMIYCDTDKIYYRKDELIKKVIFNKPATIVYWKDGTKTIVKCSNNELYFDPEKGLAMAICKKFLGRGYYKSIKKYLEGGKNNG